MKKFNQLSKAEMKKVNGGTERVCNVDSACAVFVPGVGTLFASCSSDPVFGCYCSREYNGGTYYGDPGACMSAS